MPNRSINPADFSNEAKKIWQNPWRLLVSPFTMAWPAVRPALYDTLEAGKDLVVGGIIGTTRVAAKAVLNGRVLPLPSGSR